jgi:DNA-binding NarL/FixJ family response regulator
MKKTNKTLQFLLVDDSVSILDVLEMMIEDRMEQYKGTFEYVIDRFEDINSFLQKRKPKYDVCVIDWNLPDGKGSAVIDKLSESGGRSSETAIFSGGDGDITIFTGMTDDNMVIGEYSLKSKVRYISKGDSTNSIVKFIEASIAKQIRRGAT